MSEALEILLADRFVVFQDALSTVLTHAGNTVVAAAATRRALVEHISTFQPDICVTANRFPDGDAVDVIGRLSSDSPRTKIIMLTADGNADTLRRALDAGAAGYVHKSRGVAVLLGVLDRVAEGEIVVEGSFVRRAVPAPHAPPQLLRLATYLTQRELECLGLLVDGLDTAAMSRRLGVSRTTVRSHVQSVLTKLGVHSRLEAASLAVRFGLVDSSGGAPNRVSLGPA